MIVLFVCCIGFSDYTYFIPERIYKMTDNQKMAELLFKKPLKSTEEYENMYPKRDLPEGAIVSRFAPSPTGFLHIGGLFAAFVAQRAALSTGGEFYLRIEDTDKKREVENGVSGIVKGLRDFGIDIKEGMISETEELGKYGPYIQSKRAEIYHSYAKSLVERGLAYPCFMTEEELSEIRQAQEAEKKNPGCYGEYAKYRDITVDEAFKRIENGESYVLRLKSPGKEENKITFTDGIKGEIEMPENIQDVVILKSDGIPTYHFAHAIDDHLMRTTDVIRGDEWISSVPIHVQFFDVLGFERPRYSHISPIMKEEDGGKRKLSKRKDPEAAVEFYSKVGFPKGAVIEYLLTIANSNYEQWREENPKALNEKFEFSLSKMSKAGALFDMVKLSDISKNYISTMTKEAVTDEVLSWAKENDKAFYDVISEDISYTQAVFGVERNDIKPRKELVKWDEAPAYAEYFYKKLWDRKRDFEDILPKENMIEILEEYKKVYTPSVTAETWFPGVRDMSEALGYAKAPKLFKKDPDSYRGHVGQVSSVIRVAVTGRKNSPDLFEIMEALGYDEVISRIDESINMLK